jgi:Aminoglycoside-2''-adenylyltransferase
MPSPVEIVETLRALNARLNDPVWLFGGVAVDFLVGRWTRPHGDIDLHAYSDSRGRLSEDLRSIGFRSADEGWLTHWARGEKGSDLEVVFLERSADNSGVVVIPAGAPIGVPGRYPLLAEYLDPDRLATLDGVTFRVGSPSGEWLARATATRIFPGRPLEPKIEHDRRLLEGLISPAELDSLRAMAGGPRT